MAYKKFCFLLVLVFSYAVNASAQVWELGLNAGGASYIGDLNPVNPVKISGLNAGFFAKLNFDPYWALGLHYNYGKVKASDAKSKDLYFNQRNLSFETPLNELSLLVDFNFFDYFSGGGFKKFSPYLQAGVGGVFFEPKTTYNDEQYNLRAYNTEGVIYKNYALTVIYGAGVKYNFEGKWSVFSQIAYRNAYTDYLDDVSDKYVDPAIFGNTPTSALQIALADRSAEIIGGKKNTPGVQRGDFRKRDHYMFVGIGISFTFVSQKCY